MNPQQRDTVFGTAASADAESYKARRQGNLTRGTDGFRSPTLPAQPRGTVQAGYKPDAPLAPYAYNPASVLGDKKFPAVPRTWSYFRPADLGAPRVGLPDAERTQGHLQASGQSWGKVGEPVRAILRPAVDGKNAQPSHTMGERVDGPVIPRSVGPRWKRPSPPTIRDQWLNH